jgi:hypothetical protein
LTEGVAPNVPLTATAPFGLEADEADDADDDDDDDPQPARTMMASSGIESAAAVRRM